MKHLKDIKFMAMALFVAMLSLSFTACSDDDDEPASGNRSIIGTWEAQGYTINGHPGTLRVTFNSNNKGVMYAIYDDGTDTDTYNFEFILREKEGGTTTLEIIITGTSFIEYREGVEYEISVTPTRLQWGDITYTRK